MSRVAIASGCTCDVCLVEAVVYDLKRRQWLCFEHSKQHQQSSVEQRGTYTPTYEKRQMYRAKLKREKLKALEVKQ